MKCFGPLLGGAVAGTLNGLSLYMEFPQDIAHGFPVRIVFEGTLHGAILALSIWAAMRRPGWLAPGVRGALLSFLRVYLFGLVGGCLAAAPYQAFEDPGDFLKWEYLDHWGLRFGGPVALGVALGHVPEARNPGRGSAILTLLLTAVGAGFGAVAFWCWGIDDDWNEISWKNLPTGLCHGYAFGVCYVLGTKLFRR